MGRGMGSTDGGESTQQMGAGTSFRWLFGLLRAWRALVPAWLEGTAPLLPTRLFWLRQTRIRLRPLKGVRSFPFRDDPTTPFCNLQQQPPHLPCRLTHAHTDTSTSPTTHLTHRDGPNDHRSLDPPLRSIPSFSRGTGAVHSLAARISQGMFQTSFTEHPLASLASPQVPGHRPVCDASATQRRSIDSVVGSFRGRPVSSLQSRPTKPTTHSC